MTKVNKEMQTFLYFPQCFSIWAADQYMTFDLWTCVTSAGSPTTAHRNLTSNSLNDLSDKPEKDQVLWSVLLCEC